MPDPREEAVAQGLLGGMTVDEDGIYQSAVDAAWDARQLLAAADAVDPLRSSKYVDGLLADRAAAVREKRELCEQIDALRARLAEAEADRDAARDDYRAAHALYEEALTRGDEWKARAETAEVAQDTLTQVLEHAVRVLREGRTLRETVADALDAALAAVKGQEKQALREDVQRYMQDLRELASEGREEQVCPNCEGKGHEGTGLLEDDYPCRTCMGAKTVKGREDA